MAKPRQIKMEQRGALAAMQQLETRSDEELEAETRFRAAAQAILGARAAERMDANIAAMQNLYENLADYGYDPANIPIVLQWNKRDLPTAVPVGEMRDNLNPDELPEYEAVAVTGEGVFETLKSVSKAVIKTLS